MKTFLVVEDNQAIRVLLTQYLQAKYADKNVISSCDGGTALKMIDGNDGELELVITDLEMPGMLGIDVIEGIKRKHPGVKAILMSAKERPKACNADVFMRKPFLPRDLDPEISRILATT